MCVLYANVRDNNMFTAWHSTALPWYQYQITFVQTTLECFGASVLWKKNGCFVKSYYLSKLIRQNVSLSDVVELIQLSVSALFRDWTKLPAAHMIPGCGTHARVM